MKYNDMEKSVLACFMIKPDLMKETILTEEHFINHKEVWNYFRKFYDTFDTLDLSMMMSFAKNKNKVLMMVMELMDYDVLVSRFKIYEQRLIEMSKEEEKEMRLIRIASDLLLDLQFHKINFEQFKDEINRLYETSR